jgi:segregation and condensation protein B
MRIPEGLAMRFPPTSTARQLRSVAVRYRTPLAGSARAHGRPAAGVWRGMCGAERTTPASAADGDSRIQRLEAILFLAREPLSSRKLSQYANLADGTEARTLIRQLNQRYDQDGRAFRVEEVAGGAQLLSRPKFVTWLRRLQYTPAETRLSAPALETLAVVAYRQPVLRANIEAIRGVNCGEILRQLMERDLVRIGGRSEELGRPYLYSTTRHFLQTFGLRSLDDLPRADVLRGATAAGAAQATNHETKRINGHYSSDLGNPQTEEEIDVSVTTARELHPEEELKRAAFAAAIAPQSIDEDADDFADDEDDDDDDDEDDDFDDEEEDDDFEDEDFDEDEFEDEEWEEVDDEDELEEEEDEEDDWEDDDDGWDDDEKEEEEKDDEV